MGAHRYVINSAAASVVFAANSSVHPIRSTAAVSGWFEADIDDDQFRPGSLLSGHLEIPLDGVSSGNPIIDREMRRRAGSGAHPVIEGDIETTLSSEGTEATITGTISLSGTAELVEGEVSVLPGPRIVGSGEFDIRWWGIEPPRILMLRVDPIVMVEIDLPLIYGT